MTLQDDIHRISSCNRWIKFSGCTLLITGATGMLGAYIALAADMANRLYDYGIKLILLCRNEEKAQRLYAGINGCKFLFQDIRQPLSIRQPSHYIIHAAGPVGPTTFQMNPVDVLSANAIGTLSLLEYAVQNACEGFLLASTHEVYGRTEGEQYETMFSGLICPMDPRSSYILGKQTAENALACYHQQYGLRTLSARLSRLYGPMMNLDSGLFICDFIKDAMNNRPIRVRGGGHLLRPLCYIADAAEAMLRLLADGSSGQAYNVQGDERLTINEIASLLVEQNAKRYTIDRADTVFSSSAGHWLNTDRLKGLGWNQTTSLRDGLKRTIEFFNALHNQHA